MFNQKLTFQIAIVGGGPNCTYALERLYFLIKNNFTDVKFVIHIFEKSGEFGSGVVHSVNQPKSSLLNRVIGQVAFAPDESYPLAGNQLLPKSMRPTLYEWALDRFQKTGDERYHFKPEDWPPRYIHGEALVNQFDLYKRLILELGNTDIKLYPNEVVDLYKSGRDFVVVYKKDSNEFEVQVQNVSIFTGHSQNRPVEDSIDETLSNFHKTEKFTYIPHPYPLKNIPVEIFNKDVSVGLIGVGQSSYDVILFLTVERGGEFIKTHDGFRYVRSGREPHSIVGISNTGLFTWARPFNAKEKDIVNLEHRGVVFTKETIDTIRRVYGQEMLIKGTGKIQQLDFEKDVFPIMVLEMELLYYKVLLGELFFQKILNLSRVPFDKFLSGTCVGMSAREVEDWLLSDLRDEVTRTFNMMNGYLRGEDYTSEDVRFVKDLFLNFLKFYSGHDLIGRNSESLTLNDIHDCLAQPSKFGHSNNLDSHRFQWEKFQNPLNLDEVKDGDAFKRSLLEFMKYDVKQAMQNNVQNPTKAVTDGVWRDLRDVLSYVIDFGGLTSKSHKLFLNKYMRFHNRLADGACLEIIQKIIALIEDGILEVRVGPKPTLENCTLTKKVKVKGGITGFSTYIDGAINARLDSINIHYDKTPLFRNLVSRGIIQIWVNPALNESEEFIPGGPVLTSSYQPINTQGLIEDALNIIGPPSEGSMFFQLTLGRPGKNHQVLNEIIKWSERLGIKIRNWKGKAELSLESNTHI